MLTQAEESGIRDILNDFMDFDLFSLAHTVTKGLFETNNRSGATEAIIKCLEKPSDLLKRQKVTKRLLFSYLQKVKPFVSPECTKTELVVMCLEEWKSAQTDRTPDYERSCQTDIQSTNDNWLTAMGSEFSQWFFSHYNILQDFGPEHFWVDCKMKGELKTASNNTEVEVIGDSEVVAFLSSLIINDKFFFHANDTRNSIVCEQEPHGLVRIVISGVVHQYSNCIGLFDCGFGLIKNPAYDDNWKIKWIHMKIHVTSGRKEPIMPVNQYKSICQRA